MSLNKVLNFSFCFVFQIALKSRRPSCKCHGVSGSCAQKTCWMEIPHFHEVGNQIKKKYENAVQVRMIKRQKKLVPKKSGSRQVDLKSELVFLEGSPNYCEKSKRHGIFGTKARECDPKSKGPDSCKSLCCNRGYKTYKKTVIEQCDCKFQWCCSVKCKSCKRVVRKYVCR